jgi:hypothetical protein
VQNISKENITLVGDLYQSNTSIYSTKRKMSEELNIPKYPENETILLLE